MTYVPAGRGGPRKATRAQSPALAPVGMVLAGALVAGGAVHALSRADSAPSVEAKLDLGEEPIRTAKKEPAQLPRLLALATVAPRPIASPAPPVAAPPVVQATQAQPLTAPLKAPRRDLAGFLDDQGLSFAPPIGRDEIAPKQDAAPAALLAAAPEPAREAAPELALALVQPGTAAPLAEVGAGSLAKVELSPPEAAVDVATPAANVAQTFPTVSVDGAPLGSVTMRGDKVHLASLVGLLELKMPAEEFARLKAAPASDSFVALDTLRAAGITATLDPAGERMTLAAL